ncbi:pentapeptide repeat-containing protein [Patescibacteria group bacterium]|nr:pentapeptide repeat-containing protein [Patescibacteria group bacterium]
MAENCIFQKLKGGSKSERKNLDLKSCIFESAQLKGAVFVFCDLKKVNFKNSGLENVVFEKCNLEETDLSATKLAGAGFIDCKLKDTLLDINGFVDYGSSFGFKLK